MSKLISIHRAGLKMTIKRRWFHLPSFLGLLLFVTAGTTFWYFASKSLLAGAPIKVQGVQYANIYEAWELSPFLKIFLILPVAYLCAAYLFLLSFNSTKIQIDQRSLSVSKGPLPWYFPKSIRISISEIRNLSIQNKKVRSGDERPAVYFTLFAAGPGDTKYILDKNIPDRDLAEDLKSKVEDHLRSISG